jgi:hypothetical protein
LLATLLQRHGYTQAAPKGLTATITTFPQPLTPSTSGSIAPPEGGRYASTPVESWAAPTGFDSGEPRWRR